MEKPDMNKATVLDLLDALRRAGTPPQAHAAMSKTPEDHGKGEAPSLAFLGEMIKDVREALGDAQTLLHASADLHENKAKQRMEALKSQPLRRAAIAKASLAKRLEKEIKEAKAGGKEAKDFRDEGGKVIGRIGTDMEQLADLLRRAGAASPPAPVDTPPTVVDTVAAGTAKKPQNAGRVRKPRPKG